MNKRQKIQFEKIKEFANKHGWLILNENYINSNLPLTFQCHENKLHERDTSWHKFQKNTNCGKCNNKSVIKAKKEFYESIEKLSGVVLGEYINSITGVKCLCSKKHVCWPRPTNVQQGQGICSKCAGNSPEESEDNFHAAIKDGEGIVIGLYIDSITPIECICPKEHQCWPIPTDIQQGRGMCYRCSGTCPQESEDNFRAIIKEREGIVIGLYVDSTTPIECLCPKEHQCWPVPTDIQQGRGICSRCTTPGYSKFGLEVLSYFSQYLEIQHAENGGEFYIPLTEPSPFWKRGVLIDGYCKKYNLCIEANGCLWHNCEKCNLYENRDIHPVTKKSLSYVREKSEEKIRLLEKMGYKVIVVRECEFKKLKKEMNIDNWVREELAKICPEILY